MTFTAERTTHRSRRRRVFAARPVAPRSPLHFRLIVLFLPSLISSCLVGLIDLLKWLACSPDKSRCSLATPMFGQTMNLYTPAVLTALPETNSRVVRLSSYLQTWPEGFSAPLRSLANLQLAHKKGTLAEGEDRTHGLFGRIRFFAFHVPAAHPTITLSAFLPRSATRKINNLRRFHNATGFDSHPGHQSEVLAWN